MKVFVPRQMLYTRVSGARETVTNRQFAGSRRHGPVEVNRCKGSGVSDPSFIGVTVSVSSKEIKMGGVSVFLAHYTRYREGKERSTTHLLQRTTRPWHEVRFGVSTCGNYGPTG